MNKQNDLIKIQHCHYNHMEVYRLLQEQHLTSYVRGCNDGFQQGLKVSIAIALCVSTIIMGLVLYLR